MAYIFFKNKKKPLPTGYVSIYHDLFSFCCKINHVQILPQSLEKKDATNSVILGLKYLLWNPGGIDMPLFRNNPEFRIYPKEINSLSF